MAYPGAGASLPGGGTQNQVLTKNSGTSFDVGWTTPSGGGGSLIRIATTTLSSPAATIDFSSIPGTYRALYLNASVRGTSGNALDIVRLRINAADAASSYTFLWHQLVSTTASPAATSSTTADHIPVGHMGGTTNVGLAYIETTIGHYALANTPGLTNRTVRSRGTFMHGSTAANWMIAEYDGVYAFDNTFVTQVTLLPAAGNFAAPSSVSLYGLS